MTDLDKLKKLLEKYWDRIEDWATSDYSNAVKLMELENKALELFKKEVSK